MPESELTVLLFLRRVDCNDGVASYCESIVRGLRARGERVIIVSGPVTQLYGSTGRYDSIRQNIVDWIVFEDLQLKAPKLSTIRSIIATIREHRVDVISPQGFSLLPLSFVLSKITNVPVVVNYHPTKHGNSPTSVVTKRSPMTRLAYRAVATLFSADRYIAISKDIAAFFHDDGGVPKDRIKYIPHGIDIGYFHPPSKSERESARSALSLPKSALVCVLPGRLNFVKGHDVAIDAVRLLRKKRPKLEVICLFAGGGDEAQEIENYAFECAEDSEAFRFIGFLGVEDLRRCYWAADICLLPSRFEGFPLSVPEAMSAGCVSIRTPSGGWADQIASGVNGFVVPFNNPIALADRIEDLSSAALRDEFQARAIEFARKQFDQEAMFTATADLYRSISRI
jgi:glycosyltransferase involved in cell wall biosynthesis